MKAAIVAAAIGGSLAVVEGLLLIVLGGLAGLAENSEGDAAMTDGYVVLALGAIVLVAVLVARRRPFVLAVVTAAAAAVGFLVVGLRRRLPSRCRGVCRHLEAR